MINSSNLSSNHPNINENFISDHSENKILPILGIAIFGTLALTGGMLALKLLPLLSPVLFTLSPILPTIAGIAALLVFTALTVFCIAALCQKQTVTKNKEIQTFFSEKIELHSPYAYKAKSPYSPLSDLFLNFIDQLRIFGLTINVEDDHNIKIFNSREEIECAIALNQEMEDKGISYEFHNDWLIFDESGQKTWIYFILSEARIEHDTTFKNFLQEAKNFIDNKESVLLSENLPNPSDQTPGEYLSSLLQTFDGICIGEYHNQPISKQLLINNMKTLKKEGVELLFLEHLFYNTSIQEQLDAYFFQKSPQLPPLLEARLRQMDRGFSHYSAEPKKIPQFFDLVIAAKEAGIRVIGIDTSLSYRCGYDIFGAQGTDRLYGMNYAATKIIEHEAAGKKYIALVGALHACQAENVQGLNHLLGIPSVLIQEKKNHEKAIEISYTKTSIQGNLSFDVAMFY